jgi:branched-chain amino acid aminotransferase
VFTTGTAVVVCSVGSLTYRGQRKAYVAEGQPGSTGLELYTALTQLQTGQAEDPLGWVYNVN